MFNLGSVGEPESEPGTGPFKRKPELLEKCRVQEPLNLKGAGVSRVTTLKNDSQYPGAGSF